MNEDKTYLKVSSDNCGGVNVSCTGLPFQKSTPTAEMKLDT